MIQNVEALKEFNHIKRRNKGKKKKSTQKILYVWLKILSVKSQTTNWKKCMLYHKKLQRKKNPVVQYENE